MLSSLAVRLRSQDSVFAARSQTKNVFALSSFQTEPSLRLTAARHGVREWVTMQRICELIHVRPEAVAEYKRIHAEVWPSVLARLEASHITNYSIYLREPENLLIAYYEYTGDDLAADQAAIAADPETRRWWVVTDPMQQPLASVPDSAGGSEGGSWWAGTEEVFHLA